jgi:Uma2 family endonuclease
MTVEQFFAWQEGQAERYELVNGQPLRMMAGAKNVHDDIFVNLVGELREQVRGGGCRPLASRPVPARFVVRDVGVDCGPRDPNGIGLRPEKRERGG